MKINTGRGWVDLGPGNASGLSSGNYNVGLSPAVSRLCMVQGCTRTYYANGLCNMHYQSGRRQRG